MKLNCVTHRSTRDRTAEYAMVETPFGQALGAASEGELCWLNYPQAGDPTEGFRAWWRGRLAPAIGNAVQELVDDLFAGGEVTLLLPGTPFQHVVWRALAEVGRGETLSYGALAARIGMRQAARAVGGAVGANPVIFAIPCHRVLAGDGSLHGFGCGLPLKARLLQAEGFTKAA